MARKKLTVREKIVNFMTKYKSLYFSSKEIARKTKTNWNSVRRELRTLTLDRWKSSVLKQMEYRLITR